MHLVAASTLLVIHKSFDRGISAHHYQTMWLLVVIDLTFFELAIGSDRLKIIFPVDLTFSLLASEIGSEKDTEKACAHQKTENYEKEDPR